MPLLFGMNLWAAHYKKLNCDLSSPQNCQQTGWPLSWQQPRDYFYSVVTKLKINTDFIWTSVVTLHYQSHEPGNNDTKQWKADAFWNCRRVDHIWNTGFASCKTFSSNFSRRTEPSHFLNRKEMVEVHWWLLLCGADKMFSSLIGKYFKVITAVIQALPFFQAFAYI